MRLSYNGNRGSALTKGGAVDISKHKKRHSPPVSQSFGGVLGEIPKGVREKACSLRSPPPPPHNTAFAHSLARKGSTYANAL
jgi:hypothetical protein